MDLISRQAAIDAMTNTLWHYPNECYRNLNEYEFAKGLSELGLKSVPSAQPYTEAEIQKMQELEQAEIQKAYELGKLDAESRWIPCSERLPVSDGIYIVDDYRHGKHWIHTVGYMKRSNSWCEQHGIYYDDKYGRYDKQEDIIAWMPLPEPYREEGTE